MSYLDLKHGTAQEMPENKMVKMMLVPVQAVKVYPYQLAKNSAFVTSDNRVGIIRKIEEDYGYVNITFRYAGTTPDLTMSINRDSEVYEVW